MTPREELKISLYGKFTAPPFEEKEKEEIIKLCLDCFDYGVAIECSRIKQEEIAGVKQ